MVVDVMHYLRKYTAALFSGFWVCYTEHAKEVVVWLTKPSSLSSVTQVHISLQPTAAAKHPVLPTHPQLLLSLSHQLSYINWLNYLSTKSAIAARECAAFNGHQSGPTACCQAGSNCGSRKMSSLTTPWCLIEQRKKVKERHNPSEVGSSHPGAVHKEVKGTSTTFHWMAEIHKCRALLSLSPVPRLHLCRRFFSMYATDRTIVICKISLQHIKCVNTSSHLVITVHICKGA